MIKVTIFKSSELYKGFKVTGHAGYDESGKDIVCAAVSALVINCINSIDELTDDDFSLEEDEVSGTIAVQFKKNITSESILLMDSLVLGLKAILEDNGQYIKLDFKEV